jgi:hypothetical protein
MAMTVRQAERSDVTEFFIRPRPGTVVRVRVFPDKHALRRAVAPESREKYGAMTEGLTIFSYRNGRRRVFKVRARINLHRKALGTGIIAHEVTHAALRLADVKGWSYRKGLGRWQEEWFCKTVENLSRLLVNRLWKEGFYGK